MTERPLALVKVLCIWRHVLEVVVNDLCGTRSLTLVRALCFWRHVTVISSNKFSCGC